MNLGFNFSLGVGRARIAGGAVFAGLDLNFVTGRYALKSVPSTGLPAGWAFSPGQPRITTRGLQIDAPENARQAYPLAPGASMTLTAEAELLGDTGVTQVIAEWNDGTLNNRIILFRNAAGALAGTVIVGGVATSIGTVAKTGARTVLAVMARTGDSYSFTVDGAAVATVSAVGLPALTGIQLGASANLAGPLVGYVRRVTAI